MPVLWRDVSDARAGQTRAGVFVVALAVIYAQTFPSMTSQSEVLVRLLLWLWVAINTATLVTLGQRLLSPPSPATNSAPNWW